MGYEFVVRSFIFEKNLNEYAYKVVYNGDNFDDAIRIMKEQKESGVGCVELEWR